MDKKKLVLISLTSTLIAFTTATLANPSQGTTVNKVHHSRMLLAANGAIPSPEEDTIITNAIKKHISNSKTLSRFNVDVTTDKGIVTLQGNVNSRSQASALIQLAQSIVGVRDVQSQLTVHGRTNVLGDTVITAKVKGLFIREGILGPKRGVALMNVETRNGIVYLTGNINNKQKIDRAIHLIRGVDGVKGVEYKFSKYIPYEQLQQ